MRSTSSTRKRQANQLTTDPSPPSVEVGRISGAFGIAGELKCDPSGAGWSLFAPGAQLECRAPAGSLTIRLGSVRPHKQRLLIRIDGVETPEQAEAYVGARLYAARERIALADGEYLDADLIGCIVCGRDGIDYGRVEAVQHYPASDMLIVGGVMLPMVAAFIRDIDVAARQIVIDPPSGLFDE